MKKNNLQKILFRQFFIKLSIVIIGMLVISSNNVCYASDSVKPTSVLVEYLPTASSVKSFKLPDPQISGGTPLMDALAKRKTSRDYSTKEISTQIISNLLWAAFGINRPQSGQRTAASAWGVQDIDIYIASSKGLFRYDAKNISLISIKPNDIRKLTAVGQPDVAKAPIQIIYVSNYSRMSDLGDEKMVYSWAHTGLIAQNVYLYCASKDMACGIHTNFDNIVLGKAMGIGNDEHITLTQGAGYHK